MTSIKEWQLRTELADDGLTQRVVHLVAVDKRDRSWDLTGEVLRVADIGRVGRHGGQRGADPVDLPGRRRSAVTGYGIAEYLHQVDEDGRPTVPVA